MKIISLGIENFLAITKAQVNLADRGLCLIQGINRDDTSADSNGAGKSSIADALCWALYGTTARGVSGDDVVNDAAGKGTVVEVVIEDDGHRFWISRHRKHKTGKNGLKVSTVDGSGSDIDMTKGTDKLTQDVVNKLIGASLEVFRAAVYAGQEQMPDLPALTDKNLKILIEEAAGVTILEEAYKYARLAANDERDALAGLRSTQVSYEQKKQWLEDQLVNAIAARDAWQVNQANKIAHGRTLVRSLVDEVKRVDEAIAKVDAAALDAEIADLQAKISDVGKEGLELATLSQEVAKTEGFVRADTQRIAGIKPRIATLERELTDIEHQVGCPCDECGRPLTAAELGSKTAAIKQRLDAHKEELKQSEADLVYSQQLLAENLEKQKRFRSTMTDTSLASTELAAKQRERSVLSSLHYERSSYVQRARDQGEAVKQMIAEINPHLSAIAAHEKLQVEVDRLITEATRKHDEQALKVETCDAISKVFSPAGVRAHILDEVTPFLNQQTAKYLGTLSDGAIEATWATLVPNAKGELREKFSIEVCKEKCAKSFAGLSGGEKRKVRIATALALQDLVATRATKPIELFIGDEIDDALDPAGLERLMQILEEKAQERGSVFVISHRSLRDWISQVLTVERHNNETTILEETV